MTDNMTTKKICAITTIHNTMEWFVTPIMRYLAVSGFEISMLCDMPEAFVSENSDFATCYSLPMNRGVVGFTEGIRTVWKMYKIFSREKFDIIQYTSPNASFYACIAAFIGRVPVRLYNQCGLRYIGATGKKRKVLKIIEQLTCRLSTHVRAQSPINLEFAIDERLCKREKISVVGIGGTVGIDLDEFNLVYKDTFRKEVRSRYHITDDNFVFGYAGRINKDKGLNELIQAFKDICDTESKSVLMLVGMVDTGNPVEPELLQWAEQSSRVVFTGNVRPSDVYQYLTAFDMLVHPTYREGFGKVLQEAMGAQLPIITTDVPGPSEVVEAGISGILVPVRDAAALKKQMLELSNDPAKMTELAIAGRARAEKYFDRKIMLQNILDDINKILAE